VQITIVHKFTTYTYDNIKYQKAVWYSLVVTSDTHAYVFEKAENEIKLTRYIATQIYSTA